MQTQTAPVDICADGHHELACDFALTAPGPLKCRSSSCDGQSSSTDCCYMCVSGVEESGVPFHPPKAAMKVIKVIVAVCAACTFMRARLPLGPSARYSLAASTAAAFSALPAAKRPSIDAALQGRPSPSAISMCPRLDRLAPEKGHMQNGCNQFLLHEDAKYEGTSHTHSSPHLTSLHFPAWQAWND